VVNLVLQVLQVQMVHLVLQVYLDHPEPQVVQHPQVLVGQQVPQVYQV